MITAVLFDIGGTLHVQDGSAECDRTYIKMLQAYLQQHGIAADDPEALLQSVNAGAKAYKAFTEEQWRELPGDRIWAEYMLRGLGIPAEQLAGLGEDLSYMFDRHKKKITAREGLRETLEALRARGYRLGVISNIMSRTFVPRILREHGVEEFFEYILMSSHCGVRKPDKAIFEIAQRDMGFDKREACYVGDTLSRDVRGVRNAEWELMVQIDNPRVYHRDVQFLDTELEPDYRIKALPELVGVLDRFQGKSEREGAM